MSYIHEHNHLSQRRRNPTAMARNGPEWLGMARNRAGTEPEWPGMAGNGPEWQAESPEWLGMAQNGAEWRGGGAEWRIGGAEQ